MPVIELAEFQEIEAVPGFLDPGAVFFGMVATGRKSVIGPLRGREPKNYPYCRRWVSYVTYASFAFHKHDGIYAN